MSLSPLWARGGKSLSQAELLGSDVELNGSVITRNPSFPHGLSQIAASSFHEPPPTSLEGGSSLSLSDSATVKVAPTLPTLPGMGERDSPRNASNNSLSEMIGGGPGSPSGRRLRSASMPPVSFPKHKHQEGSDSPALPGGVEGGASLLAASKMGAPSSSSSSSSSSGSGGGSGGGDLASDTALEGDFPVNAAKNYNRCSICLQYGHMAPPNCCNMPRHATCEALFQSSQCEKWRWECDDAASNTVIGRVVMPCSVCKRPWYKARPTDQLFRSIVSMSAREGHPPMSLALIQRVHACEMALDASPDVSGVMMGGGGGVGGGGGGGAWGESRVERVGGAASPRTPLAQTSFSSSSSNPLAAKPKPTALPAPSTPSSVQLGGGRILPAPIPVSLVAAASFLSGRQRGREQEERDLEDASTVDVEAELDENINFWSWRSMDRVVRHASAIVLAVVAVTLTTGFLLLAKDVPPGEIAGIALTVGLVCWSSVYARVHCLKRWKSQTLTRSPSPPPQSMD